MAQNTHLINVNKGPVASSQLQPRLTRVKPRWQLKQEPVYSVPKNVSRQEFHTHSPSLDSGRHPGSVTNPSLGTFKPPDPLLPGLGFVFY